MDLGSVEYIGGHGLQGAFEGCDSLTTLDLSSLAGIIENFSLESAFKDCPNLTSTGINWNNITSINDTGLGYAFCGCSSIDEDIYIPNVRKIIYNGMTWAFAGTGITSFSMPNLVECEYDALNSVCKGCQDLETVNLHNLKETNNWNFCDTFRDCPSLRTVDLFNVQDFGEGLHHTFDGCTSLEWVDFGGAGEIPSLYDG